MRGVRRSWRGHVGLPDAVMLVPTLGVGVLTPLDGWVLPTLGGLVWIRSWGWVASMSRNCCMIAMCLAFVFTAGGLIEFNCVINSAAALTVLSSSEMVGTDQWAGLRR